MGARGWERGRPVRFTLSLTLPPPTPCFGGQAIEGEGKSLENGYILPQNCRGRKHNPALSAKERGKHDKRAILGIVLAVNQVSGWVKSFGVRTGGRRSFGAAGIPACDEFDVGDVHPAIIVAVSRIHAARPWAAE